MFVIYTSVPLSMELESDLESFRGKDAQAVAMWLGESGISMEICGVFEGD